MSLFTKKTGSDTESNLRASTEVFSENVRKNGTRRNHDAMSIDLDRIEAAPQYRTTFSMEDLTELATSMETEGLLQPIRVRWDDAREKYIVVVGERRFRAANLLNWTCIDAIIAKDGQTDGDIIAQQIAENAKRKNVLPSEFANGIQRLMDAEGLNVSQAAKRVGVERTKVSKHLRILEMSEEMRDRVDAKQTTLGEAIAELNNSAEVDQTKKKVQKKKKVPKKPEKIKTTVLSLEATSRRVLTLELLRQGLVEALEQIDNRIAADRKAA